MTMTLSGLRCDICGTYIGIKDLLGIEEHYYSFTIECFNKVQLHCCVPVCYDKLITFIETRDISILPKESRIRKSLSVLDEFKEKEKIYA